MQLLSVPTFLSIVLFWTFPRRDCLSHVDRRPHTPTFGSLACGGGLNKTALRLRCNFFSVPLFLSFISIVKRSEIKTPWEPHASQDESTVWYQLSTLQELKKPIKFHAADKTSIRSPRWTTRLGLRRARFLSEIALETEPEWRLYEKLNAVGIGFYIEAMQPKELSKEDPIGRAVFRLDQDVAIRYLGKKGFSVVKGGRAVSISSVEEVVAWVAE